ncbi:MAG: hypothetical protein J6X78_13815 [Treponema sp.]|nr:hypothetical protein [Treponema sp.]
MKKLFGCLIAIAMVLGIVSCSKDAETPAGWQEKTVYIANGNGNNMLGIFLSEDDLPASTTGYTECEAFYIASTTITRLNKVANADNENYWTDGIVLPTNDYIDVQLDFGDYYYLLSGAGYVCVVPDLSGYQLAKPALIDEERTFYFNAGPALTIYRPDFGGR